MLRMGVLLLCLLAGGCTAVREQVDRDFVKPEARQVAAPSELGLQAEEVSIPVDGATLHGFFVPATGKNDGRTVVLCHGNHVNASMLHPWYSFLQDAGFHVLAFDPRGFGRSDGKASLRAWIRDMSPVLDWVRARPDVEPARIALLGTGMGAVTALHAAARFGPVAAVVAESLMSPRDHIRAAHGEGLGGAIGTGFVESGGVPEGIEPDENAAKAGVPLLFLVGQQEISLDRRATLRTFLAAGGRATLWALPDTGAAPHGLLTHDGEYQEAVTAFLRDALDRTPERVAVEWRRSAQGEGGQWIEVELRREGSRDSAPWAVQICAADRNANLSFHRVWLEGAQGSHRLKVPVDPGLVTAFRCRRALGDLEGTGWVPERTSLSRSGRTWSRISEGIDVLRKGEPGLEEVRRIAARVQEADREQPFARALDAQIADAYFLMGRKLVASTDASDRTQGLDWLRRAVSAQPERPALHFWPGTPVTFGFPHGDAVRDARALLARLQGN